MAILCLLFITPHAARAQERDAPKMEVGAHFTTLELNPPGFFASITTQPGVGGRFAYNATDYLGLEGEINFLPQRGSFGRAVQGQFGVKAGRRFRRFGVFGKARPGFLSYGDVIRLEGTSTFVFFDGRTFTVGNFGRGRKTYFETDLGGVLEFYPARRFVTRFDFGDTIIRYRDRVSEGFTLSQLIIRQPDETRHNFQFGAGIGFRF